MRKCGAKYHLSFTQVTDYRHYRHRHTARVTTQAVGVPGSGTDMAFLLSTLALLLKRHPQQELTWHFHKGEKCAVVSHESKFKLTTSKPWHANKDGPLTRRCFLQSYTRVEDFNVGTMLSHLICVRPGVLLTSRSNLSSIIWRAWTNRIYDIQEFDFIIIINVTCDDSCHG